MRKPQAKPTKIDPIIGANVAQLRHDKRWTQEQLAERMGYSKDLIALLELGKRPWNSGTIVAACDALNCHPAELYGGAVLTPQEKIDLTLIRTLRHAETKEKQAAESLGLSPPKRKNK